MSATHSYLFGVMVMIPDRESLGFGSGFLYLREAKFSQCPFFLTEGQTGCVKFYFGTDWLQDVQVMHL